MYDKSDTKEVCEMAWDYLRRAEARGQNENKVKVCEGVVNHILLQSMRKMRMTMTTSTRGVMFGPES